jgi:two-component system sensor histidine kinase KdpD
MILRADPDVRWRRVEADIESRTEPVPKRQGNVRGYVVATTVVACTTGVAAAIFARSDLTDIVMMYLLGIVVISMRFGFRASVYSAILSVLCVDFFFVPPYLTFAVTNFRHIITFAVMLLVAVVITGLTQRVRDQAERAQKSERRTALLYAMSQKLARAHGLEALVKVAARDVEQVFASRTVVYVPTAQGNLGKVHASGKAALSDEEDRVLRSVWSHGRAAGLGTTSFPNSAGLYLPLVAPGTVSDVVGVLGILPTDPSQFTNPDQLRLADAFATQIALAIERGRLADETSRARVQLETEQLRSTLLSSVSHDLRTPLAVMTGTASTLLDEEATLTPATRKELVQILLEESERLDRLVRNLLDMTRLESGAVRVKKEWQSVEEVVGAVFSRMEKRLTDRQITTRVPPDLLAPFDGVLIEQALVNLLENAAKYTPPDSPIEVTVTRVDNEIIVDVADRGPGIPPGQELRIFEKFQRGPSERLATGVGLGLAICRAVLAAHGGRVWAENRPDQGASFKFALPLEGEPLPGRLPESSENRP